MNYKYKNISTGPYLKRFEDLLNWQMQRCLHSAPKYLMVGKDEETIPYYPDSLKIGSEYFVGPQYIYAGENREEHEYGIYRLIGIAFDEEHKKSAHVCEDHKELFVFESDSGEIITVRAMSVILSKERLLKYKNREGCSIPFWIKTRFNIADSPTGLEKYMTSKHKFSPARFVFDRIIALLVSVFVGCLLMSLLFEASKSSFGIGSAIIFVPLYVIVLFVFGVFAFIAVEDIIHIDRRK